jgi:hypothetical protein
LVEQRIRNAKVGSSTLLTGTSNEKGLQLIAGPFSLVIADFGTILGHFRMLSSHATQFLSENIGIVCKLINDPNAPQYLATSVAQQRIALAFVAALLGLATYFLLLPVIGVDAARELAKRLKSKQAQIELAI